MKKLELKFEESKKYSERISSPLKVIVAITIVLLIVIGNSWNWMYSFLFASFLFLVQYVKLLEGERFFITCISIDDEIVKIDFKDKNDVKTLQGKSDIFKFKKKLALLNRSRTPYLAIYKNEDLVLKQFVTNGWTEKQFNEVVDAYKSMQTETF